MEFYNIKVELKEHSKKTKTTKMLMPERVKDESSSLFSVPRLDVWRNKRREKEQFLQGLALTQLSGWGSRHIWMKLVQDLELVFSLVECSGLLACSLLIVLCPGKADIHYKISYTRFSST